MTPDEYVTHVAVLAPSLPQAHQAAAHMVGVRCEMVTSTTLLAVEI